MALVTHHHALHEIAAVLEIAGRDTGRGRRLLRPHTTSEERERSE